MKPACSKLTNPANPRTKFRATAAVAKITMRVNSLIRNGSCSHQENSGIVASAARITRCGNNGSVRRGCLISTTAREQTLWPISQEQRHEDKNDHASERRRKQYAAERVDDTDRQ